MIQRLLSTHDSLTGLVLRVTLGLVMFPHGAQKLFGAFGGHGFSGSMAFLTGGAGLPWIVAFIVILTEVMGSLLGIGSAGKSMGLSDRLCHGRCDVNSSPEQRFFHELDRPAEG